MVDLMLGGIDEENAGINDGRLTGVYLRQQSVSGFHVLR